MNKALIPLTLVALLAAGLSVNWLQGKGPRPTPHPLTTRELISSDAALRHRHFQPTHWRALLLQPH